MTDIVPGAQFAHPLTGELLTLDSPTEDLASYMIDLRDFELTLREHKQMVNRELLSRMDRQARWTLPAGDYKLSAPSPEPSQEFDGAELYDVLCALVEEGEITMDAVNAAVEIQHTYKVRAAGVKALRKLDGVREVIDRHATPVEKARYVKVSRG